MYKAYQLQPGLFPQLALAALTAIIAFFGPTAQAITASESSPKILTPKSEVILPPGGVSIDFSSDLEPQEDLCGNNLITNGNFEAPVEANDIIPGWIKHIHVFTMDEPLKKRIRDIAAPFSNICIAREAKNQLANLSISPKAYSAVARPDILYAAVIKQIIPVNLEADQKYSLEFRYRGNAAANVPKSRLRVAIIFRKAGGGATRNHVLRFLTPKPSWQSYSVSFVAPGETSQLRIIFFAQHACRVMLDDISMRKVASKHGVEICQFPFSMIDNQFTFSAGDPAIFGLGFRNGTKRALAAPIAILELPRGLNLLDTIAGTRLLKTINVRRNGVLYQQYRISVKDLIRHAKRDIFAREAVLFCLIDCTLPASNHHHNAYYWLEDGDRKTSMKVVRLKIVPQIRGRTPNTFITGAATSLETHFSAHKAVSRFADFYKNTGCNIFYSSLRRSNETMFRIMGKKGLHRYVQTLWLKNGYQLGYSAGNPAYGKYRFQLKDGSCHGYGTCPAAIYSKSKYYRKELYCRMKDIIVDRRLAENFMPNWEPFMFASKGCFCRQCRADFIRFSKLPEAEVDKLWPGGILEKHKALWIRFRSWQHAKLVSTLETACNELGKTIGVESHFIPVIGYWTVMKGWNKLYGDSTRQYAPIDYLDKIPVIVAWGPYYFHDFNNPYSRMTGAHLGIWLSAEACRRWIDHHMPSKPSKLIAFPHAYQGSSWITEPEAISFEILCYFLQRWNGAIPYAFPKGYDARYWAEFAKANNTIARYEQFIYEGKPASCSVTPLSPLPAPMHYDTNGENKPIIVSFPDINKTSLLQSKAFNLNGKRLIAVGNFWQTGEAFFRLRIQDLDSRKKYILHEPEFNRSFTSRRGEAALTATQLDRGLLLHVGGLRFAFFLLEEYSDKIDYGTPVDPKVMEQEMRKRLPAIQGKYERECKSGIPLRHPSYGNLTAISNGKITVAPEISDNGKKCLLQVITPGNSYTIDPATGGRITSWKTNGVEMVYKGGKYAVAADGVWFPKSSVVIITKPYQVESIAKEDRKIVITLSAILGNESKNLVDCKLTKVFVVHPDSINIDVSTTIHNPTGISRTIAFRYHNMFNLLATRKDETAMILKPEGAGWTESPRPHTIAFYRFQTQKDSLLEEVFPVKKSCALTSPETGIQASWAPVRLQCQFSADTTYGILCWDSRHSACSSFEPIGRRISILPGQSWTINMRVRVLANPPGLKARITHPRQQQGHRHHR